MTVEDIGEYLDCEFDKVGRLKDGSINDAAMDRYGFAWAVGKVRELHRQLSKAQAQQLVKAVGWY